jgi:hypothetical protein
MLESQVRVDMSILLHDYSMGLDHKRTPVPVLCVLPNRMKTAHNLGFPYSATHAISAVLLMHALTHDGGQRRAALQNVWSVCVTYVRTNNFIQNMADGGLSPHRVR